MPFVRARHDEGDEEVFAAIGGSTVGQRDRHAVVLPAAEVREDCGHLTSTPEGLRFVSNTPGEKNRRLSDGVRIGPFTLDEVGRGPAQLDDPHRWSCRFRPRPLARFGPLLVFAVHDRYAAGRALVVDLREEDPQLREAVTWLEGAEAVRPRREQIDAMADRIDGGSADTGRHLLAPTSIVRTRSVCALLFPFVPSLSFQALTTGDVLRNKNEQRGRVPRAVALVLQTQIRDLLLERNAIGAGRYPLDWLRLRVTLDGRLRLPIAGPEDWRERSGAGNVEALMAAASSMLNAAMEDASAPNGGAPADERAPENAADSQVAGWLRGVGGEAVGRQERFFDQVAMVDLAAASTIADSA